MRTEKKKHITQMTPTEVKKIREKLSNVEANRVYKNIKKNKHLIYRLHQKKILLTTKLLENILLNGEVIEYKYIQHHYRTSERVVIRHTYSIYNDIIIVLDMTTQTIATTWKNRASDQHKTIDLSQYDKNMKI